MASDLRDAIKTKFQSSNRSGTFGNVLIRMHVQGFRCHSNTVIELKNPITAFCGANGTGKSTLLQMAAVAYRNQDTRKHFKISDFMVVGTLDPTPFRDDASVEFKYWQASQILKTTTLRCNSTRTQWNGYGARLEREVLFAGIGYYLPKIEQRDFVTRNAKQLVVTHSASVSPSVKQWTEKILGSSYNDIVVHAVEHAHKSSTNIGIVLSIDRNGITYSEAHMGFGEARTQYLVRMIEEMPNQSLILIEEPETSLHPSAQHMFGQYLVDVVNRKNHQVMLTTHSMFLLTAFSSDSIVHLSRKAAHIEVIHGISPLEVQSLLADGHVKALTVLVEDDCGEAVLIALLRRIDTSFLKVVGIHIGGDWRRIAATVRSLKSTGVPIACVQDADQNPVPRENIFSLPGSLPPEKELFDCAQVHDLLQTKYDLDLKDFRTQLVGIDHHEWLQRLANRINARKDALLHELAECYAGTIPENYVAALIAQLKEATHI